MFVMFEHVMFMFINTFYKRCQNPSYCLRRTMLIPENCCTIVDLCFDEMQTKWKQIQLLHCYYLQLFIT